MRSPTIQRILDEMDKQPWHVKLRRWIRIRIWLYTCLTRKYWDKSFKGYIFRNIKIKIDKWYKSKENGNPDFWAIDVLPQLQVHGDRGNRYGIYFGWLFWTLSIEINGYE